MMLDQYLQKPHKTIFFLLSIVFLLVGCKESISHKTYPLLDTKLNKIHLTSSDLYVLPGPIEEQLSDTVKKGFRNPLDIPNHTQLVSEELFNQRTALIPLPYKALDLQFSYQSKKIPSVKPRALKKVFAKLNKVSNKKTTYENALRWISEQPDEVQEVVSILLDGLLEAKSKIDQAFKKLSAPEKLYLTNHILEISTHEVGKENTQLFDENLLVLSKKMDTKKLIEGLMHLLSVVEHVKKHYGDRSINIIYEEPYVIDTSLGKIIIGSDKDDVYKSSALLLLDFAGNDKYRFKNNYQTKTFLPSLIVDLNGNDSYTTEENGHFGSGLAGIDILFDAKGHDYYSAENNALGSGLFGIGVLIDHYGDDEYKLNQFGLGAGAFGIGYHYDENGNDYYSGKHYSQAFAMPEGLGILLDVFGNDFYSAGGEYLGWSYSEESYRSSSQGFAMGIRGYAPGGISFLLDGTGNDAYHGAALCQGAGYWYGVGILNDTMGNDFYSSIHYAQGAGVHFGIGCLLDNEGSDVYKSVAAAQGLGYHRSIGLLVDYSGNDLYNAKTLAGGAASLSGIGILTDKEGDDTYQIGLAGTRTLGYGTKDKEVDSIGLFFDEQGKDFYMHSQYFQNIDETTAFHSLRSDGEKEVGLFTQQALFFPRKSKPSKLYIDLPLPGEESENMMEELYQILVDRKSSSESRTDAHQMIIEHEEEAVEFIIQSIKSRSFARSMRFPSQYLKFFEEKAVPRILKIIKKEKNDLTKAKLIMSLSNAKEKKSLISFVRKELKAAKKPRTISASIYFLKEANDTASEQLYIHYLNHSDPYVILSAISATQKIHSKKAIPSLSKLLDHSYYAVRDNAATTLQGLGEEAIDFLKKDYANATGIRRGLIERIFNSYKAQYR